ncbi:MAG: DNA topoisomerase VI subunit B, partial [Fervidicoccaceae archaeon]
YRNKEIAGFTSPARALYQTVRELLENALDATEAHGIHPEIIVSILREDPSNLNHITVEVEDNGIGLPPQVIPDAFGRVLYSSKYKYKQSRGMYGLGAKMAILYGQLTTGKPFEVYSSTPRSKNIYYFKLLIDVKKNEPIVLERGVWEKRSNWHGTIARLTIEGEWNRRTREQVLVYVKRTAIVTPYADITLLMPALDSEERGVNDVEVHRFPRVTELMPKPPRESKPHPMGVDLEMLKLMLAETRSRTLTSFLTREFQRIGEKKAGEILRSAGLEPDRDPKSLTRDELKNLYKALRAESYISPTSDSLSPIGPEIIEVGLRSAFEPEFVAVITRKPKSYGGHPFVVEGGIAYGGKLLERLDKVALESLRGQRGPLVVLLRYANKIPLLHDERADVAWTVVDPEKFPWRATYKLNENDVVVVLIHIASTKVPYKGVGKESIAQVEPIEQEVRVLVQELARRLRDFLSSKRRESEAMERLATFLKYIPEVSRSLALIASDGSRENSERLAKALEEKLKSLAYEIVGLKKKDDVMRGERA